MIEQALRSIRAYGRPLRVMEVCGTHTSVIEKSGLRGLLPPNIQLVSGPGCPVCVTDGAYIDKLAALARQKNTAVLSFGDMLRVPGADGSLSDAKARGADVRVIYSPLDALKIAGAEPRKTFVAAAVGFETTAPSFALLAKQALADRIPNVKLLTALKTMIPAISWICEHENNVDAFLCPGNVSVVIGADAYTPLAQKYQKPFVIAGFTAQHIVAALYEVVRQLRVGAPKAANLYRPYVTVEGNAKARAVLDECFTPAPGLWRGIGTIENSALVLNGKYARLSAGEIGETNGDMPAGCRCADVLLGRIAPEGCALFGGACTPQTPAGPCMVTAEGACGIRYGASKGGGA